MAEQKRPESYGKILEAAIDEFSEKGAAGLRMEQVAKRAGYNKSLVYRFFGDRDQLFRAALERQFGKREELLQSLPSGLGELLTWWTRTTQQNPRFMRMILREALDYQGDTPVLAESRSQYYGKQIAMLKQLQHQGQVGKNFESDYLFLALLALTIVPTALPQICQLITGAKPDSAAFMAGWDHTLVSLAEVLKENRAP